MTTVRSLVRLLSLAVLAFSALPLLADPGAVESNAGSGRRRPARSASATNPNPNPNPGGDCINFKLATPGMKGSYRSTNADGSSATYSITWVSDSVTQTKTTQKVQTPQGVADVETTLDYESVPGTGVNLRAIRHILIKGTLSVFGFPVTTESEINYVPSLVLGPVDGWCQGATWNVPASTQTVVVRSPAGAVTTIVTSQASVGKVLAVNESVTVPAGTFNTIKLETYSVSGTSAAPTIAWNSVENGMTIRQQTLDSSRNVTSTTELVSIP